MPKIKRNLRSTAVSLKKSTQIITKTMQGEKEMRPNEKGSRRLKSEPQGEL